MLLKLCNIVFCKKKCEYKKYIHLVRMINCIMHINCTVSGFSLCFRWLVIAVGLVRAYLTRGSYHGLYYSIEKPLKFFQTGALLEVSGEL